MMIEQYLQARQQRINSFLQDILPNAAQTPNHLHEAMHYVVLNGGKRVRPLLVYATGEAFGVDLALLDHPASSIELIHAYSLVHDDLPAMDNDDLRRGKPTCHKAYDEATAILVGDALQALAFDVLSGNQNISCAQTLVNMIGCLARASGSLGMAGGQALDLKATGQLLQPDQLKEIHALKTGALITACIQLGLAAAQIKNPDVIEAFTRFAYYIGLCFQIQDDILDAEGSVDVLGKEVGSDKAKQKATFATLNSIAEAKNSLQEYYSKAMAALDPFEDQVVFLKGLAGYIVNRDH